MTNHALLIEDDLFFQSKILSALQKLGCTTVTARSRDTALEKAHSANLVLINLAKPTLGGVDMIREIKQLANSPKVVAYLSHVKIADVRDEVLAAGADKLCPNSVVTTRLGLVLEQLTRGEGDRVVEEEEE